MLKHLIAACLILTALMGPMGLEALSELSGLTIVAGHYEFQEGGLSSMRWAGLTA